METWLLHYCGTFSVINIEHFVNLLFHSLYLKAIHFKTNKQKKKSWIRTQKCSVVFFQVRLHQLYYRLYRTEQTAELGGLQVGSVGSQKILYQNWQQQQTKLHVTLRRYQHLSTGKHLVPLTLESLNSHYFCTSNKENIYIE